MTKKILFRADGSSNTGLGHLYRLFSLVEIVKDTFEFVFLTHQCSTSSVIPKDYNIKIIPKNISIEKEPDWLVAMFPSKEYIIIADGYQFVASYQKKIKSNGYNLIYVDDLAKNQMYADVVINHSPNIQETDYKKETYTKLALGTQYALLRPLFLKEAKDNRVIKNVDTAFICFGGADPFNLTLKTLQAILDIKSIKNIHVVLGGAYKHKTIFYLEENYSDRIKLYRNLSEGDLLKTMQLCNFAVAPASTILYELCCVKMPIFSGFYIDNQKLIYDGLSQKGAIIEGGDFRTYSILDFKIKIESFLKIKDIDLLITNQGKLFDGKSKSRLLGLINGLNISFRKADEKDVLLVYDWSNDALVRQNSFNSNSIEWDTHKNWYFNKIKDDKTLFLIALVNNKPAGIVRYEIGENNAVIGISISKTFRGQKLAVKFLIQSSSEYFKVHNVPILACIKKENIASIKAFESADYGYFKEENDKGLIKVIYKLEKHYVE